jgi:hypothetical protein
MAQAVARRRAQDEEEINYLAREAEAPPVNLLELAQQVPQRLVPRGAEPVGPGFEMLPAEEAQRPERQYGPPVPQRGYVDFPIGRNGETERRAVGVDARASARRYPSPASATNPIDYAGGVLQDIGDDPWKAATQGIPEFFGAAPTVHGFGSSVSEAGHMTRGPRRAFTEAEGEAFTAARRNSDIELSRKPPYAVQKRVGGKFQKFDEATRIERERGIAARRADQQARETMAKKSAEDAEIVKKHMEYMQKNFPRKTQAEAPSQEFLDTWKRRPKKPFPPY